MFSSSLYLTLELARDARIGHCEGAGTCCCPDAMPQNRIETARAFTARLVNLEIAVVFAI